MGKGRLCRYCGKAVEWAVEKGRSYPLERVQRLDVVTQLPNGDWDVVPGETVLVNHLPICPEAPLWQQRRERQKQEALRRGAAGPL